MNPELPAEARAFGESARRAFDALGGVDCARRAEADHTTRELAAKALVDLGIDDIDPRANPDAGAAAAALCEAAGSVMLPHPVAGELLRGSGTTDDRDRGLPYAVVDPAVPRIDHGDLFARWDVATLDGGRGTATSEPGSLGTRLGPFVSDVTPEAPIDAGPATAGVVHPGPRRASWFLALCSWQITGALSTALRLASGHTGEREQFGKPLTAFQVVRFALADAAVAVAGLRELAHFTLWRLTTPPDDLGDGALHADALALRCHAQDCARTVLRSTQQLHGAAGLCDEYDISIVVRHLQPLLRLPETADATALRLAETVGSCGFEGLFPHGTAAVGAGGRSDR